MDLLESLNRLCQKNLDDTNEWYTWKINEWNFPVKIDLPEGNQYLRNMALKKALHEAWKNETNKEKRGAIIKYYIKDWGGIARNSEELMAKYMYSTPETLIEFGKNGIASWSKALVIHDPDKYAIFDARVSMSLNCLQIIYDTENKVMYPKLGSRNKTINEGQKLVQSIAKQNHWEKVNTATFYSDYLALIGGIAKNRGSNLATIEMLLFAKAEQLVNQIKTLHS